MKSLAVYLDEIRKPLKIDDVEIPKLTCGQILVKINCATICGAQIGEITGAKGEDKYLPHMLGHEGSGIVLEVGEGVRKVKEGDHVTIHWRKGSGIDCIPPKYKCRDKVIGGGWNTTFQQYSIISENRLTKIPDDIPYTIGSLLGCGVTTGLGIITNEVQLKIGQSIAVMGVGGVGMNVIQGAKMASAHPIFAIDNNPYKGRFAYKFGTDFFINNKSLEEIKHLIKSNTNKGVDVFVECTGKSELIDLAVSLTASNGKIILVGQPQHNTSLVLTNMQDNYCGKIIMDSQGGLTNPDIDIPRYINLIKAGKLNLDEMITHTFHLTSINDAIELMKTGSCLRIALEC